MSEPSGGRQGTKPTTLKWLGTALQLVGCFMLALHLPGSAYAFPVMLAGSALWSAIALRVRDWPLAALSLAFSASNIIGIWRWLG